MATTKLSLFSAVLPAFLFPPLYWGELLGGFAAGNREAKNRRELQLFLNSPQAKLIPIDQYTADHYAKIYWQLRQNGTPIPTNDMWIAAAAIQHNLALLTNDKHFQNVQKLKIVTGVNDLA